MITFPNHFTANFVAWALSHKIIVPLDLATFKWYSVYRQADNKIHYRLNGGPVIMGVHGDSPTQFRSLRDLKNDFTLPLSMPKIRLDFEVATSRQDCRFPVYTNLSNCRHFTEGDAVIRESMYKFYLDHKPRIL